MSAEQSFQGQTALVTGGTRGIGAAIVQALVQAGAQVIATGRDPEAVRRLNQDPVATQEGQVAYWAADFAHPASLADFLAKVEGLERLEVCVNNAGINVIRSTNELSEAEFELIDRVNLRAPFLVAQAASRVMARAGYGRVVNIASIWGVISKPGRAAYTASKHGLVGLTKTLALDLAPTGVLVNAVSPGFTLTELTRDSLSAEEMASLAAQVPLGRLAQPEEMARVVLFLASRENTYITGQNIVVDGGFSIV
ncbi:MAG: glucose 1-dehydrogenase [Desulfarculus sp.]|jgi:3-oxoacyl-[acyl-carrier protein] reductase|nr:MAG: glucose 1-dehydrogenase [Desulfarculus sp.]